MLYLRRTHFLASWCLFDIQFVFGSILLTFIGVANATVQTGVLRLSICDQQSVALLLLEGRKFGFANSKCEQKVKRTLKLYGNSRPFFRSQVIRAYGPVDDVQSTFMDSPGRRYDRDGSNFKNGSRCDAKCLKEKNENFISIYRVCDQTMNLCTVHRRCPSQQHYFLFKFLFLLSFFK